MEIEQKTYIETKPTTAQNIGRILLGSFLTYTGIGHLTFLKKEFLAQHPSLAEFSQAAIKSCR